MSHQYYPRRLHSSDSSSSHDSRSRRSNDSYTSRSTAPTSIYSSSPESSGLSKPSPLSTGDSVSVGTSTYRKPYDPRDDVSPATSLYPRSSIDTFVSTAVSCEDVDGLGLDDTPDYECAAIPPLPVYRREIIEPNIRPSAPQDFAKFFPSLNRFTIRHDEFTADGNMNLRIDTVVTGRRRTAIQLFHLRMYDLAKREFSLRRYSRDSGREVCNSKRKFTDPRPADGKPTLKRSMSTAIRTLGGGRGKTVSRRPRSAGAAAAAVPARPGTGYSTFRDGSDDVASFDLSRLSLDGRLAARAKAAQQQRPVPTNTIKLEFSNYARVDVERCGGKGNKRYEFEWWGHRYHWKRAVDKQLGLVSFHLIRDGDASAPVAHIVPETRSPSQVLADETAGGWVPPCFMWIADETVIDAVTDVADVIMATGLMALVDDCIKERWEAKKPHRLPMSFETISPKAIIQHVFGRRHSVDHQPAPSSPLRFTRPVEAY
ncbi:hypothetical protein VTK26DRAFT_5431 [Humicola hyalothermophila]